MTGTVLTLADLEYMWNAPDFVAVAILADNFEDQGDLRTAEALRWLTKEQRWPAVTADEKTCLWFCADDYGGGIARDELPNSFFCENDRKASVMKLRVLRRPSLITGLCIFIERYWNNFKGEK